MRLRPLFNRVIVVTRPRHQARPLCEKLSRAGARVLAIPVIRIAAPRSFSALDEALRSLPNYDAIAFTSRNAVDAFFNRLKTLRLRPAKPPRIFAVGPATAEALRKHGWRAKRVPETHRGEALARAMGEVRGLRILLPRARIAREALPRLLRARGARVTIAEAYQTLLDTRGLNALRRAVSNEGVDAVVFTSGSIVRHFARALGYARCRKLFATAVAASIGPVTSQALRAHGIESIVQAPRATAASLAAALRLRFSRHP